MKLAAYWILVIFICLFAVGCAYFSDLLIISSSFILEDIDYTEMKRQSAERKAAVLSLIGYTSLCISIAIFFLSAWIARLILKMMSFNDAL